MSGYPIGQQDFKQLRTNGLIYVDKTSFIEKLIMTKGQYYFLARPRRFGKSLFLSTIKYFFLGERELFKGLYIDSMNWKWEKYPVLHLDLNTNRYQSPGMLEPVLDRLFRNWEEEYDVEVKDSDYSQRFSTIIKTAHERTGLPVVILVDEYDKPLVGNLNSTEIYEHYRSQLASIYSNFKSSAEHIRLVFLTGVSRFSKLSVFSDLNNINDITFDNDFADVCGITESEMLDYFKEGINELAKEYQTDYDGIRHRLKLNYDGYRFAKKGSDIYNPWSLLNTFSKRRMDYYWTMTGLPTIIAESLKRIDADLKRVVNTRCSMQTLSGMDLLSPNPIALMYQTGYLTIKQYDNLSDRVSLGIPNREVEQGLFEVLLPYYVKVKRGLVESVVNDLILDILDGNPKEFMKNLDIFLAGIPYDMKMEDENNFHNAMYILLTLIGIKAETEVHTSDGRIDLIIKTDKFIYIIELKFDKSSESAMKQIEDKNYAYPYSSDSRQIFLIGANFSSETRHLDKPVIREIEGSCPI
ncbi:MAG: ATP-binding protein, partial [Muribaculaceae bacterium]|nr:ATP-binding protein [Muribaculaceae bacterium]